MTSRASATWSGQGLAGAQPRLSQDALAAQINYSPSLIGMIESGRRAPTLDVAGRLDQALKATGTLARLQKHARTMPLPSWFRPYGLLQTEEYARAVLATKPNTTIDVVDEMVAARMDRQLILDQDKPPILWIVADEAVLHRLVGSPRVMHEQLMHVAGLAERPNVNAEIVPATAGSALRSPSVCPKPSHRATPRTRPARP